MDTAPADHAAHDLGSPTSGMDLDAFVNYTRGLTSPSCQVCQAVEASADGGACDDCKAKAKSDPFGLHKFWRNVTERLGI